METFKDQKLFQNFELKISWTVIRLVTVVHAFNLNILEAEAGEFCEFYTNLVYVPSSRSVRAGKWDIVSKQKQNTTISILSGNHELLDKEKSFGQREGFK